MLLLAITRQLAPRTMQGHTRLIFWSLQFFLSLCSSSSIKIIYDKEQQCIRNIYKDYKDGRSKIFLHLEYNENGEFPKEVSVFHEFPIEDANGDAFSERGAVKYTISAKNIGQSRFAPPVNHSFILNEFDGVYLPNSKEKWIYIGQIPLPEYCGSALALKGSITKSCSGESQVVSKYLFKGFRPVSDWIQHQIGSMVLRKQGDIVSLISWGNLEHLSTSPCENEEVLMSIKARPWEANSTRITWDMQTEEQQFSLNNLPDKFNLNLQPYDDEIHCRDLELAVFFNPLFEKPQYERASGLPLKHKFEAVSKVSAELNSGESALQLYIKTVEGLRECLKIVEVHDSTSEDYLAGIPIDPVNNSISLHEDDFNFCQHPFLSFAIKDRQDKILNNQLEISLLSLENNGNGSLTLGGNGFGGIQKCQDHIFFLKVVCSKVEGNGEDDEVIWDRVYLKLGHDISEKYPNLLNWEKGGKQRYCRLENGQGTGQWVRVENEHEDMIDIILSKDVDGIVLILAGILGLFILVISVTITVVCVIRKQPRPLVVRAPEVSTVVEMMRQVSNMSNSSTTSKWEHLEEERFGGRGAGVENTGYQEMDKAKTDPKCLEAYNFHDGD